MTGSRFLISSSMWILWVLTAVRAANSCARQVCSIASSCASSARAQSSSSITCGGTVTWSLLTKASLFCYERDHKIRSRMSAPPPRLRAFHFVACQADHPYTESGINIRNTTTKNTKNDMDPASRQHLTLNITSSHVLTYASTNPPCNQISEDIAPADGATNKQTIPRHQSSPLRAEVSAAKPP